MGNVAGSAACGSRGARPAAVSLPLYMDHNIDERIVHGLRRHGIDVVTAADQHAERLADDLHLEHAVAMGRILCTEDEDIVNNYEGLTLGQVFAALAYYYDHKEKMDRQIGDDHREFEEQRAKWREENPEMVAKLEARRQRR